MNGEFTVLEKSILDWIIARNSDPALASQIKSARVAKREYTGAGWFIDLEVPEPRASLKPETTRPIDGPYIRSPQIDHGGGSILFHQNGVITTLEMYANGGRFDKELRHYELHGPEDAST